jgi:putative ABC transport system substrate-binding protein
MNNRRKLLIALGAIALTAPLASFAQQKGKVWRVGFLFPSSRQSMQDGGRDQLFLQALRELGYVEGKNLLIEWRFADGNAERLPALAMELVALKVDVLVTSASPATSAAQKATATIPIVFANVGNPVAIGFVKNLARPGGNMTGLSNITGELGPKHLEMLLSMAPKVSRMAVLVNSGQVGYLKTVRTAAPRTTVTTTLGFEARNPEEIEDAFARMTREKVEAVIVGPDALFTQQRRQIAKLAAKHRLPSIALNPLYPAAGGLMSYGQNSSEIYLRLAAYVDKILKGAKPADLPVEQPMRFELVINAKTAKALGLTIPQELRIMADKVIEW